MNNSFNQFIVVYLRPGGVNQLREITTNVVLTVQTLEAQGCIIIDIIDIGFSKC